MSAHFIEFQHALARDHADLALSRHHFQRWWIPSHPTLLGWGDQGRRVIACAECGIELEGEWQLKQICLGVVGELMRDRDEIVPARWTGHFFRRMGVGRRAMKPRKKQKKP